MWFEKNMFLMPWDGLFCIYVLSTSGLMCGSKILFPYWFLFKWSMHWYKWGVKFSTIIVLLSLSPYMAVNLLFIYLETIIVGSQVFTILSSSWSDHSYYVIPLSPIRVYLKSILIKIMLSSLFCFASICMECFLHYLTFSLYIFRCVANIL